MPPASNTVKSLNDAKSINIGIEDYNLIEERFDALEKQLEQLFGQVLFGLHTLDAHGTFLSINEQELAWIGYTQQEVVGQLKFIDLLTTESRIRYITYLDNQLESGVAEDIDLTLVSKSNVIKNITLYSTPVFNADGILSKCRAVLFNIDERKFIESQLAVAAIAFESQQGIMVTDANAVILQVNSAFTKITGFSSEEAIGQTPQILDSGVHDSSFYKLILQNIINAGSWEGEIFNRRKSGEVYPSYLRITAVKNTNDKVINYVVIFTDVSSSHLNLDAIKNLEFYDQLTQLPNRRLLFDRLDQALILSERTGLYGALLILDLDHFKTLNDTRGHNVGDLLLEQVAMRLAFSVREGDTVARIGGDEFAVLLEALSKDPIKAAAETTDIAEKIIVTLHQHFQLDAYAYHNTCSIGATLFKGHKRVSDDIFRQADIAMYESKNEGHNRLRFFDHEMQETINARVDLERELRKAIDQQEFVLRYQIQVDNRGVPVGAEALIRWMHPERGIITPVNFITLAEETGLIVAIGEWVLNQACIQLNAWKNAPTTKEIVLSVNVSALQFQQVNFVERLLAIVNRHQIKPSRLKLELTESMLIHNIDQIVMKMEALNKVGICFSLDDFGTGYSSLQYLKKLPLSQLKIDQSFVRDIGVDSGNSAIIQTIINIAHSLDLNVIAEGVETEEQWQYLVDNGCMHYQGYLFGKPLPIDEFEALLSKK